ncbi:hypothetical protein TBLA_0J01050 [Henningerozyma blattae CBS 6284]|uniref:Uncharacterized protein n=1 Tax=Henningerozyma blattae (strain ATCC 34711 / CBS 6284 / DSM 70876 / NBRC 10599 / NRRL Y-10934 / UCD 77-7) TaxID=1071380 RepID=I2H9Q1_HENB6|nr:hypothetical protein TBLA_0J01050 [Tetrapisispora blattae CBS 6284]CCH63103.1 hypothetical protein TBLA_0J01050 [Tetrapisispora blattae CBS 6284]
MKEESIHIRCECSSCNISKNYIGILKSFVQFGIVLPPLWLAAIYLYIHCQWLHSHEEYIEPWDKEDLPTDLELNKHGVSQEEYFAQCAHDVVNSHDNTRKIWRQWILHCFLGISIYVLLAIMIWLITVKSTPLKKLKKKACISL